MYKPTVKLIGMDGNAFFILGRVKKALQKAEDEKRISVGTTKQFIERATSGDYNHLLAVVQEYVEVE